MALSDSFSAQWITPALGATFDFNGMLNTTIEFNASSTRTISDLSVVLCQLDDASATPSYVFVADVVDFCLQSIWSGCYKDGQTSVDTDIGSTFFLSLVGANNFSKLNFFYCFALNSTGDNTICAANSYSPLFNLNGEGVPSNIQTLIVTASTLVLSSTSAVLSNEYYSTSSALVTGSQSTSSTSLATTSPVAMPTITITAGAGQTVYCSDCVTVSISPTGTTTIAPTFTNTDAILGSNPPSSGLTIGSRIGIGIGIPLFLLLFIGTLYFLYTKKKKRKLRHPNIPELPLGGHHEKAELEAVERLEELEANGWNWLVAREPPYELGADVDTNVDALPDPDQEE